jgi:hypothetical protein
MPPAFAHPSWTTDGRRDCFDGWRRGTTAIRGQSKKGGYAFGTSPPTSCSDADNGYLNVYVTLPYTKRARGS